MVNYCKERGGYVITQKWTRAKDTYEFKCGNPDHPTFKTSADALYSGRHWCPYCSGRSGNFEDEIKNIIESKDGTLLSHYTGMQNHVKIKCNKHNYEWEMMPLNIKKGRWCPICSMGFNERVVWDYFNNMMVNSEIQYSFDDLSGENGELLKFDFAVMDSNGKLVYLVEVDDEEHRDFHYGDSPRQIQRRQAIKRDKQKDKFCKDNNIPLYRMEVPFRNNKKWDYEDYYRYINTELKFIINKSRNIGGK